MAKFKIFYSWQSDLPGSKTRYFIRNCIDDAIAFAEESEAIEAVRDEATKGTTGSPNIVNSLFSKIDECDLFVADMTLCFSGDFEKDGTVKHAPNPNVLLELGYAVKNIGWDRVICICNSDYGTTLPFDIAQNRIIFYSLNGKSRKEKENEQRKIAKDIFSDLNTLKGTHPRTKAGIASHIIGSYDFTQKRVISNLIPIDLKSRESYQLHNKELLNKASRLLSEIKDIDERIRLEKEEEKETVVDIVDSPEPSDAKAFAGKPALQAASEFYKNSETPVIWKNIEDDKSLIKKWLGVDVDESFFDLGSLKYIKPFNSFFGSGTFRGTADEEFKYEKMLLLEDALDDLEVRTGWLETFEGMYYIPLAIQNISQIADRDIRIVVHVESGEIVTPSEHLIIEECEGLQRYLCSDNEEVGIIPEIFGLEEDGFIHLDESADSFIERPQIPVFNGPGYSVPEKTAEDYELELKSYIATLSGHNYYEYFIQSLRPNECCWLSGGMLLKPTEGKIVLNYNIHSIHTTGELSGKLELIDEPERK